MKKIIINSTFAILVVLSTNSLKAQDFAGINMFPKNARVVTPETNLGYRILERSEVNVRAARDFSKKYDKAEDITWVEGKNGISVYFKFNGLKMRSTYDKAGKKEYTLKYFSEAEMPKTLRHLVKSSYYDHDIEVVTQVERNGNSSYLVQLQNDKEFLTLKIIDGEITPYARLLRAK